MALNLLLSENFPPHIGGSSRWFWELYSRLPADEQWVCAGDHPDAAAFDAASPLRTERVPLHMPQWGTANIGALRNYCGLWKRIGRTIKQIQAQTGERVCLHAGRCLPEGWLAWLLSKRYGVPYVVYVHGEDVTTAATSREYRAMVRRVFRKAAMVIANSQNTADILRDDWKLANDQVRLLYPGVDTQRFRPAARDATLRAQLGWSGRTVILTVGRLQRRKGQDHLIAALPRVLANIPDVLYCVCGEGEERASLEAQVRELGLQNHVQLVGAAGDDKLIGLYQQCDLFALPNRTIGHDIEGFGMVLVEAQACGKVVLAGRSGGTRETLAEGRTGWLVDCDAPEAIAAAICSALADRQRLAAMESAARAWAVERFDWQALASEARKLFREAAAPNSKREQHKETVAVDAA